MNRRGIFSAGITAAVGLATVGRSAMAQTAATAGQPSTTFVLVHGAWHGGWCWSRVAQRLRRDGHVVYTPTLSGLGERSHLLSPQVNLDTHIQDVVNVLEFEELENVVLVGHSYGGIIISGVADRVPSKLRQLVFLDSLLLESGKSLFSDFPQSVVNQRLQAIRETGAGVGAPAAISPTAFGVKDAADVAWVKRRMTPQPVGTYLQPLQLKAPIGNGLHKTYIDCTVDPIPTLEPSKAKVRADPSWQMRTAPWGHDAMVVAPEQLSAMLVELALSKVT